MSRHAPWLAAFAVLVLLAIWAFLKPPQTADLAGNEIGMPVAAEFRDFYQANGGLRVFGYPLTEAYLDSGDERLIQYFQRLRLEYDRVERQISVTPLGSWAMPEPNEQLLAPLAEVSQPGRPGQDVVQVQDAFLAFYQKYGGQQLFGKPISTELDEGGTRVQYFENALLVWVPEAPLDYRVQLGRLGDAHYRQVGVFQDPGRSRPLDSAGLREAEVRTTLRAPILYSGEEQAVFVEVKAPQGQRPVAGVSVAVNVRYNGITQSFELNETDSTGHTRGTLHLDGLEPGQTVRLTVEASAPGGSVIGTASNSFKSWW